MSRVQRLCHQLPKLLLPCPPLDTFTLFPKLPPELRNKIWSFAARISRDINLFVLTTKRNSPRVEGQSQHPAILHTCHESRVEAARYYTRLWENAPLHKGSMFHHPDPWRNYVFVNFELDRFLVRDEAAEEGLDSFNFDFDDLTRVQHLNIDFWSMDIWSGGIWRRPRTKRDTIDSLLTIQGLKRVSANFALFASISHIDCAYFGVERNQTIDVLKGFFDRCLQRIGRNGDGIVIDFYWGRRCDLALVPVAVDVGRKSFGEM